MQTIPFNFKNHRIAQLEAKGLSKCFAAYAEHSAWEDILEVGFNPNSGYTYIALESGLTIASMLGRDVEYIVFDGDTEEELFFATYYEVIDSGYVQS